MTFSAVAEVHASASVIEDDILVVQASEQRTVCNTAPGRVPKISSVPAEPWKHSAHKMDLDGTPMEEIVVLEPLAFSVPDVSLDSRPMAGKMDRKPLEHAVPEEDLDGTPMEEIVVLEPLPLLVPDVSLDSRTMAGKMDRRPLEHAVPEEDRTGRPMEGALDQEPLEHSAPGRNELQFGTVRASGSRPYTVQR